MGREILTFKWTVSRARETLGYNICSLYVNDKKVSGCNGGGYDMKGTALGSWMEVRFKDELLRLDRREFYGLTFHDPNYDPSKKVIEGETVEHRELAGKSLGLERHQAFYSASSKVKTWKHITPLIDGACGMSSITRILEAVGYELERTDPNSKHDTYMLIKLGAHEKYRESRI